MTRGSNARARALDKHVWLWTHSHLSRSLRDRKLAHAIRAMTVVLPPVNTWQRASKVADHLVSIFAVRVEPREGPRDLEPIPLVELDRVSVAHANLELNGPHRPEGTLLQERVHEGRSDPPLSIRFKDREHQDPSVLWRVAHARDEPNDPALCLRDNESVPPPLVDVHVDRRRIVLAEGLPHDPGHGRDIVRGERSQREHGACTADFGLNVTVSEA